MSKTLTLTDWLSSLAHISNVESLTVEIGGEVYEAARYVQTLSNPDEEPYTREAIYVIGKHPNTKKIAKRPESKCCFTFEGDKRDWYVACHSPDFIKPEFEKWHPFGQSFILMTWDADGRIDEFSDKPYTRIPIKG